MSTKRIMSIESNIYHRPSCKYVYFMKPSNKEKLLWEDAKRCGRPCRHCNSMSFLCTEEGIVVLRYMHMTDGNFCEDNFRYLISRLTDFIDENFEEIRRLAAGRLNRFHRETLSGQLAVLLNDLETY